MSVILSVFFSLLGSADVGFTLTQSERELCSQIAEEAWLISSLWSLWADPQQTRTHTCSPKHVKSTEQVEFSQTHTDHSSLWCSKDMSASIGIILFFHWKV